MEKKKLYFLRHAQSEYNKIGILQGDMDPSLSKEGRSHVKKIAPKFKEFGFKNIVHSSLLRAIQTAEIINEELNLPVYKKDDLREMEFGEWSSFAKYDKWIPFRRDFYANDQAPPGGESKSQIFRRVEKAVHEVCLEVDDDPILVVAHGMVIRVLIGKWFTNDTEEAIRSLEMHNLSMYEVEVEYDGNRVNPIKYKYINTFE